MNLNSTQLSHQIKPPEQQKLSIPFLRLEIKSDEIPQMEIRLDFFLTKSAFFRYPLILAI